MNIFVIFQLTIVVKVIVHYVGSSNFFRERSLSIMIFKSSVATLLFCLVECISSTWQNYGLGSAPLYLSWLQTWHEQSTAQLICSALLWPGDENS